MTNLQSVQIKDPRNDYGADVRKQASAFPPNFVHSLDSTHMLMTALGIILFYFVSFISTFKLSNKFYSLSIIINKYYICICS